MSNPKKSCSPSSIPSGAPLSPKALLLLFAPAGLLVLAGLWRAAPDVVDDAYITFRCVANLLAGEGLTFNPGTRVEAFSNPTWAALLLPWMALGLPPGIGAKLFGLLALTLAMGATWRGGRALGAGPLAAATGAALVAGHFPLVYYATTGLETGLVAALLGLAVWRFAAEEGRLRWPDMLLWGLLGLSRPEAPVYLVVLLIAMLLGGRGKLRQNLPFWAAAVAIVAAGFLLRRWYYGLWLPNPFYAKGGGGGDLKPETTWAEATFFYTMQFVLRTGGLWLGVALVGAAAVVRGPAQRLLPAAAAAAGLAFALYAGGDWFPGGRYFLPVVPVLGMLAAVGLDGVAGRLGPQVRPLLLAVPLAWASFLGAGAALAEFTVFQGRWPYHVMNAADCRDAGRWIRDNTPPEARVVAYRIGALGYYSDRYVVDLLGLASHDIALMMATDPSWHPKGNQGEDLPVLKRYLREMKPDFILYQAPRWSQTPEQLERYNLPYARVRSFPQGIDQTWTLYRLQEQANLIPPTP